MKKHLLTLLFTLLACVCYADVPYTPPATEPSMAMPNTGSTTTGNSDLLQTMQQQTTQALQAFQNVNYKSFSTDSEDFMDSSSDSDDGKELFDFNNTGEP